MVKKGFVRALIAGLGMAAIAGFTMAASAEGTLNVQFVPTNNDGSMEAKTGPFADYLSEKLDMDVNVTLATDYSTIVEAMASGMFLPLFICCLVWESRAISMFLPISATKHGKNTIWKFSSVFRL